MGKIKDTIFTKNDIKFLVDNLISPIISKFVQVVGERFDSSDDNIGDLYDKMQRLIDMVYYAGRERDKNIAFIKNVLYNNKLASDDYFMKFCEEFDLKYPCEYSLIGKGVDK